MSHAQVSVLACGVLCIACPAGVLRYVLANHRVVGIRGMKVPLDRIKSMEKRRP
jgi:hypothetical protein